MCYYFDLVPNEIISLIFAKIDNFDTIFKLSKDLTNYKLNYKELMSFRYPYLYSQINFILDINTKFEFDSYISSDDHIHQKIYIDSMKTYIGFEEDTFGIISSIGEWYNTFNFPETVNVFSMILLYKKYPNFYKNVRNYLNFSFGPHLFTIAVLNYEIFLYRDFELREAFKYLIENGTLRFDLEIYVNTIEDEYILQKIFIIHIIKNIVPKEIRFSDKFLSLLFELDESLSSENVSVSIYTEYKTYGVFYPKIIRYLQHVDHPEPWI